MKQQNFIYLGLGIVATILFYVLRVSAYECIYAVPGFSDQFYNAGLYDMIPLITIAVPWATAGIYYYAINSVRFDRWYHWLLVGGISTMLTIIIGYAVNSSVFSDMGLSYGAESLSFELANAVWAVVMFIVASFSMRWWSSNCRHTPIPQ